MMVSHRELFAAENLKMRIFVRKPRATIAARAGAFGLDEPVEPDRRRGS